MQSILAIREIQLLVGSGFIALVIAWVTVPEKATHVPIWPTRLYLFLIRMASVPGLRGYSDSRKLFSRREQFLTSFFVWFFLLFVIGLYIFDCGRHGC